MGAVAAIEAVWERLGLGDWFANVGAERGAEALADVAFAMVSNRLVTLAPSAGSPSGSSVTWPCPRGSRRRRPSSTTGPWTPSPRPRRRRRPSYGALCDLTSLDLRLVCYDLTSTTWSQTAGRRLASSPGPLATPWTARWRSGLANSAAPVPRCPGTPGSATTPACVPLAGNVGTGDGALPSCAGRLRPAPPAYRRRRSAQPTVVGQFESGSPEPASLDTLDTVPVSRRLPLIGPRKRRGDFSQVARSLVADATADERPADVAKDPAAVARGRQGGQARAAKLTAERRREIAVQARAARKGT